MRELCWAVARVGGEGKRGRIKTMMWRASRRRRRKRKRGEGEDDSKKKSI